MKRTIVLLLASCCWLAFPAPAQVSPAQPERGVRPAGPDGEIVDVAPVVVSGALPGPGLWRVRNGDNTLYVLGTISPLPKRMEWQSARVEGTIARAQAVLLPPSFTLDSDIGFFRGMLLLPSLLKARRNPDGRTLEQSVPPDLYARWKPLKARYIGGDRGIEQWRPIFAAQELYEAAMRKSGLTQDDIVDKAVTRAAKRHKVERVSVNVKLTVEDPKSAIREFRETTLADTDCFAKTLARIETDLDAMRQRANAWAVGDVDALRALPYESQYSACVRAVTATGLAQRLGIADLRERVDAMWLAAAEKALAENASTVAILPMSLVLSPQGYLAQLEAKGYAVEPPSTPVAVDGEK